MKKCSILVAVLLCFGLVVACASIPNGIKPVSNFDLNKYLGEWYEIARFDFAHEKDMDNVTARYSLNKDGSVRVENRGYDYKKGKWKESIGKAKFVGSSSVGELKVSFFGPFYSGYNVIKIDPDYNHVLVVGENYNYLWILSRTKTIPEEVKKDYVDFAKSLGFDMNKLVWTKQL
ncbi:MAG: lipocalin [Spirochaetaceae bacterium]|nr:lipocalin [Spirochaetaceae bacterium]